MKDILITGINGLLGSNLARQLIRDGCTVRGLVRAGSDRRSISDLDVELIEGDTRDMASVREAMFGQDTVFHTAAIISYVREERDLMFAVNIEGTRNVVDAALDAGVRRFIHTSSVAALPLFPNDRPTTEETPHDGEFLDVGYRISKYRSEQIVLEAVKQGLDAVILNPSIMMGPGDYKFHGGRMIKDVYAGKIFTSPPGGTSVVSVSDVVAAHIAAARVGRTGERYILSGENLSFKEIFRTTADVVGGIRPLFTVPGFAVRAIAGLSEGFGKMTGTRPWLNTEVVAGINIWKRYSSEKAKRELEFHPKDLRTTVQETFSWYRDQELL